MTAEIQRRALSAALDRVDGYWPDADERMGILRSAEDMPGHTREDRIINEVIKRVQDAARGIRHVERRVE